MTKSSRGKTQNRKPGGPRKAPDAAAGANGGQSALIKELWQAAVHLRGAIEPADYKRYVLPIILLRFLSLRYWSTILEHARADNIKVRLDDALEALETAYPDKLRGLLPRIYAGSNLDRESVTGLINLVSKDIFKQDHGGEDLIGRVYEYFIGEFANSEGKRGGEYFTPASIVRTLSPADTRSETWSARYGILSTAASSRRVSSTSSPYRGSSARIFPSSTTSLSKPSRTSRSRTCGSSCSRGYNRLIDAATVIH